MISLPVVAPELSDQGRCFGDSDCGNRDAVNGATCLHEIYTRFDPAISIGFGLQNRTSPLAMMTIPPKMVMRSGLS